ncbi:MAG TPA: ribosome recycling factor, partial [Candidatus Moranbacteria bacterium]|nr:ribosome recycling factor [Candidatus Moranbacteria bacterium]
VRRIREEIWNKIQELEKKGEIAEDEKFVGKDKIQKIVDEYNSKIKEAREKKEKEVMTV